MAKVKRSDAAIFGAQLAAVAAVELGQEVRGSRERRRMTQAALARTVGISRQRLGDLEAENGGGAPATVWFAVAKALDRYLRFEFARDPKAELADAGHLDIQELVLRVSRPARWERLFEARSRAYASDLSVDVKLVDKRGGRMVIAECWNRFGDLGASARSGERKLKDAEEDAVAIAGDGEPFQVGLVWIAATPKPTAPS